MDDLIDEPVPSPKDEIPRGRNVRNFFRNRKFQPAVWMVGSLLSLIVNVVLIGVVIALMNNLFAIKSVVQNQLLGGLYENFILMSQSSIQYTVPVNTTMPVKFDLPLNADTVVTLLEDTPISNARVTLYTGGLTIVNAPTDIVLPAGTRLPIRLDMVVPVDQTIPVSLEVMVDIPLKDTELNYAFLGLQNVIRPYYQLLKDLPDSWEEAICGNPPGWLCAALVP
jgi:hypothetical protein